MGTEVMTAREQGRRVELIGTITALVILACGAAVRLPTQSMWVDEAFTRAAVSDLSAQLQASRASMVLYVVVVWAWAHVSTAIWWLRIPSVIAAGAALLLLRPVARKIGGPWLVAVGLPATSLLVGFEWISTTARAYSLETLLTVAAWFFLLYVRDERVDDRRQGAWKLLAVVSVAGIGTHGLFVLQLIPIAVVAVALYGLREAARGLVWTMVASSATFVLFLVAGTEKNGTYTPGGYANYVGSLFDALFATNALLKMLLAGMTTLGIVVIYLRIRERGFRKNVLLLIPVFWVLIPPFSLAIVDLIEPVDSPRYILPILPGLGLLLGYGSIAVGRAMARSIVSRNMARYVSSIGLLLLLAIALVTTPYPTQTDWRGAADLVAAEARPGDAIVFADAEGQFPQFTRPAFEASWGEHHRAVIPRAISPARPLGDVRARDKVLGPDDVAVGASQFDRVWFVQSAMEGVPDRISPITAAKPLVDFRQVGSWRFGGGIRIELWAKEFQGSD